MELLRAVFVSFALISVMGIVIAFSPTLILTELTILTRSKKPVVQTLSLIAGIALAIALFCAAVIIFVGPNSNFTVPSTRQVISSIPIIDIIAGILLVITGLRLPLSGSNNSVKKSRFSPEKLLNTKTLFWFGLVKMATSLSSIAAIFIALRFIMTSVDTGTLQLASILWLILVAILPFAIILSLKQYKPDIFAKIQNASDRAVNINWRRVIAFSLIVAGSYFIFSGLLHVN